jgi:hypothetical protein
MKTLLTLLIAVGALGSAGFAQDRAARVTFLSPKSFTGTDLRAGYKKHLNWHRQAVDQRTWYAWTIISGEHSGTMVDLTIVNWEDLDHQVDPGGDAADFNTTVAPEARSMAVEYWRVPDSSRSIFENPTRLFVLGRLQVGNDPISMSVGTDRGCALLPRVDSSTNLEMIVLCQATGWGQVAKDLDLVTLFAQRLNATTFSSEVLRYEDSLLYAPQNLGSISNGAK